MVDLFYAHEVYAKAVRSMAVGESPLAKRLADAYKQQAVHAHPPRGDAGRVIPDELQSRIESFHSLMTARGSIDETVDAMNARILRPTDPGRLHDAAEELCAIADELASEIRDSDEA